jgi:hypothetical protein
MGGAIINGGGSEHGAERSSPICRLAAIGGAIGQLKLGGHVTDFTVQEQNDVVAAPDRLDLHQSLKIGLQQVPTLLHETWSFLVLEKPAGRKLRQGNAIEKFPQLLIQEKEISEAAMHLWKWKWKEGGGCRILLWTSLDSDCAWHPYRPSPL